MTDPTLPEGWPTGVREHGVRCCSEQVLAAAAWAVTAYPALMALVERWRTWAAIIPESTSTPELIRCSKELAAILALAKEEKKE